MKLRNDLLDDESPKGMEVLQLTTGEQVDSCHLYMEAQVFTPNSKRLLVHESAHAHGSDQRDPRHRYLVCDLENQGALSPLTVEVGATAPSVTPDGKQVYYFVNETELNGGRLTLKRVGLDGSDRQTLLVLDGPLPGTNYRASRIYPLSTIRADGQRLALSCFLGDGQNPAGPWGLMVFDLVKAAVTLILAGPDWCNIHPQYCRSPAPGEMCDILVQQNHGCAYDPQGIVSSLTGGQGADIHLLRDDGSRLRTLPWGRDGNEFCQGHQCWRGRTTWAITSTGTRQPPEAQLIESQAVAADGDGGSQSPGGIRNHLSRSFPKPDFHHFATDIAGARLVSDAGPKKRGGRIFLAQLQQPGMDALTDWTHLLNPRNSWEKETHIHPFLSPDGAMAFFNSDESGRLQAYMIKLPSALFPARKP